MKIIRYKNINYNSVDLSRIAGKFSDEEKRKLLSGDGFVHVPAEELEKHIIKSYSYLL